MLAMTSQSRRTIPSRDKYAHSVRTRCRHCSTIAQIAEGPPLLADDVTTTEGLGVTSQSRHGFWHLRFTHLARRKQSREGDSLSHCQLGTRPKIMEAKFRQQRRRTAARALRATQAQCQYGELPRNSQVLGRGSPAHARACQCNRQRRANYYV